ncbi:MAG: ParB/RepB/Spo0J family partition protein [Bacteroidota bacterium]
MSKTVLGKGLSALLQRSTPEEPRTTPEVRRDDSEQTNIIASIELDRIRPNPFQPRMDFNVEAQEDLKRSIREKGVIQPITVRRTADGNYGLISGERRVRASQEIGLKTIPAYIVEVKRDEEMLELALVENLQREHLNPIEVAISYQRLIDECDLTQELVAQKIGKDRTTVTNFLRLLKLPAQVQLSLRREEISMGHARALIALPNEAVQLKIWHRIIRQGLSVRRVEELVRTIGNKTSVSRKETPATLSPADGGIRSMESRLRHALGTKVQIKSHPTGKGEITIEYYSPDDLERIVELISDLEKRNI